MSEELIVRHCSPTLAGLKTANLFRCSYTTKGELCEEIRRLNRLLSAKGLRILPLRITEHDALIYVYRPKRLKYDLSHAEASLILEQQGYFCDTPEKCIVRLISRLGENEDFPHEIGLFLGYPPEDVRGFMANDAKEPKLIGHWKVYGDAEKAERLFAAYKKCTESYMRSLTKGNTIECLAVAG